MDEAEIKSYAVDSQVFINRRNATEQIARAIRSGNSLPEIGLEPQDMRPRIQVNHWNDWLGKHIYRFYLREPFIHVGMWVIGTVFNIIVS